MVSDLIDDDSNVRVNRKNELVITNDSGNTMIGISYLSHKDCDVIKKDWLNIVQITLTMMIFGKFVCMETKKCLSRQMLLIR